MKKLWSDRAWDDYLYWQMQDKKALRRINELIKSLERCGLSESIGKHEPLRHRKAWSWRIDEANQNFSKIARLVDEHGSAIILKNNIPRYLVIDFKEANADAMARDEDVMAISRRLIMENREVYEALAK